METDVLLLLSNLKSYNRFSSLIREDRLSKDIRLVYQNLLPYFEGNRKDSVDWSDLRYWIHLKHPNLSEENAQAVDTICSSLQDSDQEPDSATVKIITARYWANQISEKAYEVGYGNGTLEDVQELIREYKMEVTGNDGREDGLSFVDVSVKDLLELTDNYVRYDWSIPEFNLMLGPISKGDFIIIGGRPDGGKTTILANQATHWATQLEDDECILWCNNEEGADRVKTRLLQASLGWTNDELLKNKEVTSETASKTGYDKIKLMDNTAMTAYDIEAHIAACNPKVIIVDQIWKVGGFEKESNTSIERYAKLAQYMRGLAKKHGPVIGASQLDATAENVKYPTMASLYNSKTSVQGEADAIVTIGQSKEEGEDIRFLRAPKNKLRGAKSEFRNQGCAIRLDKERARLVSLIGDKYGA